jgi:LysM repeat protein
MMKGSYRLIWLLALPIALLFAVSIVRADTIHVVQPGDTLFRISVTYNVAIADIVAANNIINPRVISIGQELIIPGVDGPVGQATPVPTAQPTKPVMATPVEGGVMHLVQTGDTLFRISVTYDVAMADIIDANNIVNPSIIVAGRELFIPGATVPGGAAPTPTITPGAPATTTATTPSTPTAAPAATNLFTNGSFEGDWYFYLYNELQVPAGWLLATDEGPNTLDPGSGGLFNRPEVRVVGKNQLPEAEWDWFVLDGYKSVKVFKGGAPTAFSLFQDVNLQPGKYRMTLNFFPDIVAQYFPGGSRDFDLNPLAGEVRVIQNNGGSDWTTVTAGQRNSRVYDFTVNQAGVVRLGADFRNRFQTANNGWFLDDWRLERIGN